MDLTTQQTDLITQYLQKNLSVTQIEQGHFLDRLDEQDVRVELAELDLEFFNRFYLAHHFVLPPAPIHRVLTSRLQKLVETPGRCNGVYVMPRGHAKTTIGTLGLPLWCAAFTKKYHIPIISDSWDQARDQLSTIKVEIEDNDLFIEDFGQLRGNVWQASDIFTTNQVRIRALGQGMKVRGRKIGQRRPDLIVADDLEEIQSVQSQAQREALLRWFRGSLMRSGWKDTAVVVLGNFLHHDCLLANLVANPLFDNIVFRALEEWPERLDLWDRWRAILVNLADAEKQEHALGFFKEHEADMLKGAKVAWPEAYSLYDLMVIRVSEGDASFNMELQNNPQDPTKQLFTYFGRYRQELRGTDIWLVPVSGRPAVRLQDCAIFAFTDPSMGSSIRSDFSAIIVIAKTTLGQMFVLEADIKRRAPDQIMKDQNLYAQTYRITRWGIEKNQFQALFATQSAQESAAKNVYLPVQPVNQLANKPLRIQSLQPDLENQYILLPVDGMELLKQQLAEYPSGAHDDGPDALEGARTIAKQWEPLSGSELVQGDMHQFAPQGEPRPGDMGIMGGTPTNWDKYDKLADETIAEYKKQQRLNPETQAPQSMEEFLSKVLRVGDAI